MPTPISRIRPVGLDLELQRTDDIGHGYDHDVLGCLNLNLNETPESIAGTRGLHRSRIRECILGFGWDMISDEKVHLCRGSSIPADHPVERGCFIERALWTVAKFLEATP
ncbi:MAG: hypothetical protein Q4G34_08310 [Micrococcus sp.]|nr:hypothetical protein [Micrococcus sp.]